MNPNTIRWIDVNMGRLICGVLTWWRSLMLLFAGKFKPQEPQKILFIKFIEQGATVLANSAIQKAVDKVGKENVYFCVFEENAPVIEVLNLLPKENVLVLRPDSFFLFLGEVVRTLFLIRKLKIDTTIDMEFFSRASAIFAYMSGARNRVGLHRFTSEQPYRGNLMTHRVQHNPYFHTAIAYMMLVEALYEPFGEVPPLKVPVSNFIPEVPRFVPNAEERETVIGKIKTEAKGQAYSRIVLLNPNASDLLPLRKWPTDRFVALAHRLLKETDDTLIVLTGAPGEREKAEEICTEIGSPRLVSLAGKTTLRELFVLYTLSDLLVTNDSGPAHFASTTDVRIVVLFGPETPQLFGPLNAGVEVIWKNLGCSPCINAMNHRFSPCNNNVCMQEITMEEVWDRVHLSLQQPSLATL